MKKRLLALALCLVLATSLLPITAAAVDYHFNSASIVADGVEYRDTSSARYPAYYVNITGWTLEHNTGTIVNTDGFITVSPICCSAEATDYLTDPPVAGVEYFPYISILNDSLLPNSFEYDDDFFANLVIPGYETNFRDCDRSDSSAAIVLRFRMVKHSWQFSQTDSTLTAKCRNSGCPIQTVDVTLAADSVTLPESPFNARLEGLKQFQQEVPDAVIGEFVYKYKGPGDTEYRVVQPTAANAKQYAQIVADKSLLRQIAQAATDISGIVSDELGSAQSILDAAEQKIYAIRNGRSNQDLEHIRYLVSLEYTDQRTLMNLRKKQQAHSIRAVQRKSLNHPKNQVEAIQQLI